MRAAPAPLRHFAPSTGLFRFDSVALRRTGVEQNIGGSEEPHSDDPELWNIDGTEIDFNAKYKLGGQMWYLQSRMQDAIKKGTNIAGVSAGRSPSRTLCAAWWSLWWSLLPALMQR